MITVAAGFFDGSVRLYGIGSDHLIPQTAFELQLLLACRKAIARGIGTQPIIGARIKGNGFA